MPAPTTSILPASPSSSTRCGCYSTRRQSRPVRASCTAADSTRSRTSRRLLHRSSTSRRCAVEGRRSGTCRRAVLRRHFRLGAQRLRPRTTDDRRRARAHQTRAEASWAQSAACGQVAAQGPEARQVARPFADDRRIHRAAIGRGRRALRTEVHLQPQHGIANLSRRCYGRANSSRDGRRTVSAVRHSIQKAVPAGTGPSEALREKSWFRVRFAGEGGGETVVTEFSGGDPATERPQRCSPNRGWRWRLTNRRIARGN